MTRTNEIIQTILDIEDRLIKEVTDGENILLVASTNSSEERVEIYLGFEGDYGVKVDCSWACSTYDVVEAVQFYINSGGR